MIGKGHMFKDGRISPSQFLMLVILHMRKGPMYGYEVLKEMREEFAGLWEPQTGAVYPALKKLEEHGLLRSEMREGRDYYSLTDEGQLWLKEHLERMSQGMLLMSRYFQVVNEAAKDMGVERKQTIDIGNLPMPMMHLLCEDLEPKDRLKHMRKVREMLGVGIAELDKEIEKLETETKEE